MLSNITKSQILADRFAFTIDEQVLVPALDLCDELIAAESLRRDYNKLLRQYQILQELYRAPTPTYRTVDLKA